MNRQIMLKSKYRQLSISKQEKVWNNINIHQAMIQDKIRTLSYKKAIENTVQHHDVVIDLGCGTGILSFFAAKKRCKKIYAIENSDIINDAIETAKINNLEKDILFIKRDIFSFRPREKIDVLIHEQIGNFLWDEGLVSKVAYVRDNFLGPNGVIIPFKIDLFLVPSNYSSLFNKSMSFWPKNPYGIDFSNLRRKLFLQQVRQELRPQIIRLKNTKTFLCRPKLAYSIDLRKEKQIPRKITAIFRLQKYSKLRGMCAYIKVYLDKIHFFSTKPAIRSTHWGQIFLPYLGEKIIRQNSVLYFTLFPRKKYEKWKFRFELK
jgi:SAM-dependent methyltransferase